MPVRIINSLETAADAYIATAPDDPTKDQVFTAVTEWLAHSYEQDGDRTEAELNTLDFASLAHDYIDRRIAG